MFEQPARLARQDLEYVSAQHLFAADAAAAKLAIAIPGDDAHISVNDVKRDGKGINDLFGEPLLLLRFARPLRHFDCEIDRGIFRALVKLRVTDGEAQLLRDRAEEFLIVGADSSRRAASANQYAEQ